MIIENDDGSIAFKPDYPGAQQGQPLGVKTGDNVTWNNTTDLELVLISPGLFITDPIAAGNVSDPIFNVTQPAGTTIAYSCVQPKAQHSIVVS
jgi:hypothetical protein